MCFNGAPIATARNYLPMKLQKYRLSYQHAFAEAGRARVWEIWTIDEFRVPSLKMRSSRLPYGSFGQFPTLRALLDYLMKGADARLGSYSEE